LGRTIQEEKKAGGAFFPNSPHYDLGFDRTLLKAQFKQVKEKRMKTGMYRRGALVIALMAFVMLSGCELFTGPTGATGAAGAEGPSVYLKTASGERIYSGGTFYLGEASANGSLSVSATFSLVNSTGHSIELTGSGYLVTGLKSCLSSSGVRVGDKVPELVGENLPVSCP
jgi:hypothetical protein